MKREDLLSKERILQKATQTLKKEFVGIDRVIDQVMASLSPWYFFPDLQEKPVVVNLWGLTGVGKSSLIQRLAELIRFSEKYYCFDMGVNGSRQQSVRDRIDEIHAEVNNFPSILVMDEFQHARTIEPTGAEVEKLTSRIVWQLLDTGKFQTTRTTYLIDSLYQLILQLDFLLNHGVKVVAGRVVHKKEFFNAQMEVFGYGTEAERKDASDAPPELYFVPEVMHSPIYRFATELFYPSYNVKEIFRKLNGRQTIDFLQKVLDTALSPRWTDCSKSIIFVIGNLDEAYTMSNDFNPDMDADEFHEQSLKINTPMIKKALKERFRNEQIARLGNNHIIYPAFSRDNFNKIITMELQKIAKQMLKHHNIRLTFDQSIHELIYNEGVYPAQGIRPVLTTIQQFIKNNLAKILTELYLNAIPAGRVNFAFADSEILLSFYKHKKLLHTVAVRQELSLTKLRENKRDDMQAIVAVHEAGHAIISAILLHTIPEVVFSNTASQEQSGFLYSKFKWNYISRKEICNRMALYLGGLVAEKIVFGEENVTASAEDDIFKATAFVNAMLKENGMGNHMIAVHAKTLNTRDYHDDFDMHIEKQAREWIDAASDLAEKTLKQQEKLLLRLADYLSDHRSIKKDRLRSMIMKYAVNFDPESTIEDGSNLFYRQHLKQKVNNLGKSATISPSGFDLQLNSNEKPNP